MTSFTNGNANYTYEDENNTNDNYYFQVCAIITLKLKLYIYFRWGHCGFDFIELIVIFLFIKFYAFWLQVHKTQHLGAAIVTLFQVLAIVTSIKPL